MTIDLAVGDDVRQLRKAGERPNERLVNHILRSGPAARPHLIELAVNVDLLHGDEPDCYAPMHALRLLGELPALEMIEPLLAVVPLELYYDGEMLPQMWGREMPQMLARIGAPAAEPLWTTADDSGRVPAQRAISLVALSHLPRVAPDQRDALVAAMRERLASFDDPTLVAYVLMALGEMQVSDIYPEAMRLFREGKVNQSVLPPGVARQLLLSPRKDQTACVLHPLWERYEQHPLLLDDEDEEDDY